MKHETVAGLDIGTTKTCAVVAAAQGHGFEILGYGEAPSPGMRKGVVVDLDETVKAIESAVERAERMAGIHVQTVQVAVSGDHLRSTNNRAAVAVHGEDREVSHSDVGRVVEASKIINLPPDRQIIHALPRYFTVDGQDGVEDPVGMAGGRLEVDTHIVTAGTSFITNVLKCVHRAGLEASGVVFQPLASSAATLLAEEKAVGVVLLDIGGGTTDIAVYSGGSVIFTATIPVGGAMLTNDISLGLKTTSAEAEQIKRVYGVGTTSNGEVTFPVKTLDGRGTKEFTSAHLRQIAVPRVLETLRMAKAKIVENVPRDLVLGEVVITGGTGQLNGIEDIAEDIFGLPARVGTPGSIGGLTQALKQPEYACAVGLILFAADADAGGGAYFRRTPSAVAKFRSWLGELWN